MKNAENRVLELLDLDIFWGTFFKNPPNLPRLCQKASYVAASNGEPLQTKKTSA